MHVCLSSHNGKDVISGQTFYKIFIKRVKFSAGRSTKLAI